MRTALATLITLTLTACSTVPGGMTTQDHLSGQGYRLSWGDGRRTIAFFSGTSFTFTPVLASDAPAEAVRELYLSHEGEVVLTKVGEREEAQHGELTKDEARTWQRIQGAITFDWAGCPRLPGPELPRYTWIHQGGVWEGLSDCPPHPKGLTMVLAPETVGDLNGFLNTVSTRLTGKPIV